MLTVNMPRRHPKPGDPATARIDAWVDSVVADIDDAGLDEVVIVGHSMAGLSIPGVVANLGSACETILAAAFVPPQGTAFAGTIPGALGW